MAIINGTVVAQDVISGNTVVNENFTLEPDQRLDIDFHSKTGSPAFGPVRICHDAPRGALKATMNQYRLVTTDPLNFTPVAQSVFSAR